MKLTNTEIYSYALALNKAFTDNSQRLPVKVGFYLQKNKNALIELARGIEESRMEIIRNYGNQVENTDQYQIDTDKVNIAQKELNDLLDLEQEVTIYKVNIDTLPDDLTLTTEQMEAMMFMIE